MQAPSCFVSLVYPGKNSGRFLPAEAVGRVRRPGQQKKLPAKDYFLSIQLGSAKFFEAATVLVWSWPME